VVLQRLRSIGRRADLHSEDPRAIERELDRWLKRRMSTSGDPVQFVGVVHTRDLRDVASRAARADAEGDHPGPPTQRWPVVLWVMKPAAAPAFVRRALVRDLYVAPQVGMFSAEVARRAPSPP
jgi:hypothetical protein